MFVKESFSRSSLDDLILIKKDISDLGHNAVGLEQYSEINLPKIIFCVVYIIAISLFLSSNRRIIVLLYRTTMRRRANKIKND